VPKAFFPLAVLSIMAAGCASTEPPREIADIRIENRSGKYIEKIVRVECGQPEDKATVIATEVPPWYSVVNSKNPKPGKCINFYAYGEHSKVIARQRKVSVPPSFTWTIR